MVDDVTPPHEVPAHVQRARQSLMRPRGQFSLRTVFVATLIFAVLSVGVRWSSGSAMLDFIPLCGALVTVVGGLALLYQIKPLERAVIGGLAVSCGIGLLAMVPLWVQEGLDQRLERGRVNWERVSGEELLWPFLNWLLGLSIGAAVGMVTAGVVSALYLWQRRKAFATARLPQQATTDEQRFLRVRREVAAYQPHGITILLVALLVMSGFSVYILEGAVTRGGANMLYEIDTACWLGAICATLTLLVVGRQLLRNDGVLIGGAVFLLSFAGLTMVPIWQYLGGEAQAMVGYAALLRQAEAPVAMPSLLVIVVATVSDWLWRCASIAALGALVGAVSVRWPKRRRRAAVELPPPPERERPDPQAIAD